MIEIRGNFLFYAETKQETTQDETVNHQNTSENFFFSRSDKSPLEIGFSV